jgi:hypothetical protein
LWGCLLKQQSSMALSICLGEHPPMHSTIYAIDIPPPFPPHRPRPAQGITLVLNVKPELMERLGRCIGARVIPSVDQLTPACMGTCRDFRVETVQSNPTPGAWPWVMLGPDIDAGHAWSAADHSIVAADLYPPASALVPVGDVQFNFYALGRHLTWQSVVAPAICGAPGWHRSPTPCTHSHVLWLPCAPGVHHPAEGCR